LGSDKSESVTIPFVLLNGMIKPPPPQIDGGASRGS
jgi:hypothetical protein